MLIFCFIYAIIYTVVGNIPFQKGIGLKMYKLIKKVINVLALFWWFVVISAEVHPFVFGKLFSKSLTGIFYIIGAVIVVVVSIAFQKWDVLAAAFFAAFIYIGIVWTALPISKLLVEPKWQFVPWVALVLFDIFDIGEFRKRSH